MEGVKPSKILRKSIHVFLKNYQFFTLTSALIAFPYSVSFLLSQDYVLSSSSSSSLYTDLGSLVAAANFPDSGFFSIAILKLSQTISSSLLTLPFTLTFFLFAKASVIHSLAGSRPSLAETYFPILKTYVTTWLVLVSVNATVFFLLFFAFSSLENFPNSHYTLFISAASAVVYSVVLANTIVICNIGLVLSGVERISGSLAIVKAFVMMSVMMRGRASAALSLALPLNIALAATELLFQFRVSRKFHEAEIPSFTVILEGLFVAYLYSILLVLETVVGLMFFKSCRAEDSPAEMENGNYYWKIQMSDREFEFPDSLKQPE